MPAGTRENSNEIRQPCIAWNPLITEKQKQAQYHPERWNWGSSPILFPSGSGFFFLNEVEDPVFTDKNTDL